MFLIIAGPCSVESYEQMLQVGWAVKEYGGNILRGELLNLEPIQKVSKD